MAVYTIEWKQRKGGGVPETRIYQEAASQTFSKGDILVFDTSLEQVKLATDSVVQMVGIAQADASGTTGADIPVLVPTTADVFTATISSAGANLAAAHDKNNIGLKYSWIKSTESGLTDRTTIDEADTGNAWVLIEDVYVDALEPEGTAGGRVLFRFLNTPLEGGAVA